MNAAPPTTAIICAAGPVRTCHSKSSEAAIPGSDAPITRRSSSRSAQSPPCQQAPTDRAGHRQRHDQRRDSPPMGIEGPCFLDVAQPQPIDLGRQALGTRKAVRPGQCVKAGKDSAPRQTQVPSRRFQSPGDILDSANISAPPSSASLSHTGDKASHTAFQLSFEAKTRKLSAVPPPSDTA